MIITSIIKYSFFIVAMVTGFAAYAQTLSNAYKAALAIDPQVQIATQAQLIALEKTIQSRAVLLPTVSLNGNLSQQRGEAAFNDAPYLDKTAQNWSWSVQLNVPLWRPSALDALSQANIQADQAALQLRLAEQDLMLRVAQNYLDVWVASESVKTANTQWSALSQQLKLAENNYRVGTSTITDVYEAKSRLALSKSQWIAAQSEAEIKTADLERLTGLRFELGFNFNVGSNLKDTQAPLLALPPIVPTDKVDWIVLAQRQHLQVQIAAKALQVAEQEIKKSTSAHSPTLDLSVNTGNNYSSGAISSPANLSTRHKALQTSLTLNIPLYSGGATSSRVREAEALRLKADAELELAKRVASQQALQAFVGVRNGQAQMEALSQAVTASQSAVEASKVGYRTGTRISIDVLNAEQQFFTAQRDLFKTSAESVMQGLRLKSAVGDLKESDLQVLNPKI